MSDSHENSIVTDEMRAHIGRSSEPVTYDVTARDIASFAAAIGDDSPAYINEASAGETRIGGVIAPPTFLRSLVPGDSRELFPEPLAHVLDAGSRYRFLRPARAGDRIKVTRTLKDLFVKSGRLGQMLFKVAEITYEDRSGQPVATQETTTITYGDGENAAGRSEPQRVKRSTPGSYHDGEKTEEKNAQVTWYEDVDEGAELPSLTKLPTTRQLVMYAGASGDFNPIHYDRDVAQAAGHDRVIIHGALKSAWLAQVVTGWMGNRGSLREFSARYGGIDYPDETKTCTGVITGKHIEDGAGLIEISLALKDASGDVTTTGTAIVALSVRAAANSS